MRTEVPDGYTLREVDRFEEPAFGALVDRALVAGTDALRPLEGVAADEQARILARREARGPRPFELRAGVFHEGALVAWTFAAEESRATLMMQTSGVDEPHRRNGLYTALLRHVVARAREEGYERVSSLHAPANRAILIAKLREGFVVSGMQMNVEIGLLVRLELFLHPIGQEAFEHRVGWKQASPGVDALRRKGPRTPRE